MRPFALVLPLLVLVACGDSRGVMVTGDGRIVPATSEAYRDETALAIAASVQPLAPADCAVAVAIDELPHFGAARRDPAERWRWSEVHATVTVRGVRAADSDVDAIAAMAKRTLSEKADRRDRIHIAVIAEPTAPIAVSAAAPPDPVEAAAVQAARAARTPGRSYTARSGDTLADISLAFYGSSDHWRQIRDANPRIDFATLVGGETIVIPAR